jgi:hypothetical protein
MYKGHVITLFIRNRERGSLRIIKKNRNNLAVTPKRYAGVLNPTALLVECDN